MSRSWELQRLVLVELRIINISPVDQSSKYASIIIIMIGRDLKVAGPHMPKAFWHGGPLSKGP